MPEEKAERTAYGWCHDCGTVQFKVDMPERYLDWAKVLDWVSATD